MLFLADIIFSNRKQSIDIKNILIFYFQLFRQTTCLICLTVLERPEVLLTIGETVRLGQAKLLKKRCNSSGVWETVKNSRNRAGGAVKAGNNRRNGAGGVSETVYNKNNSAGEGREAVNNRKNNAGGAKEVLNNKNNSAGGSREVYNMRISAVGAREDGNRRRNRNQGFGNRNNSVAGTNDATTGATYWSGQGGGGGLLFFCIMESQMKLLMHSAIFDFVKK